LSNWGTARAFRNPAVFSSFAQGPPGSIYRGINSACVMLAQSCCSESPSIPNTLVADDRLLTMFTPPPGRITTLSSAYSRNRRQRLFLRAAHGYVWYAQCNVQACVVQRPRPTEGHPHAASDQLYRGLLWQRLTCRPGMLGASWKSWGRT